MAICHTDWYSEGQSVEVTKKLHLIRGKYLTKWKMKDGICFVRCRVHGEA